MPPRARLAVAPLALLLLLAATALARAGWPDSPTQHVPLCTVTGSQTVYGAVPDGSGGAIVPWIDDRTGVRNVYARRVTADGVPMWTENGAQVCTAAGWKGYAVAATDDAGGIIVAWADERSGTSKVYAQRLAANGKPLWTTNGVAIATTTSLQTRPDIVRDGAGGAIVIWQDYRGGSWQLYAQRIDAAGATQWASSGVAVCTAAAGTPSVIAVEDGFGGAIVVWDDVRTGNSDVYAALVSHGGSVLWATNGTVICDAVDTQYVSDVVSDDAGGAFITWTDYRSGDGNVYLQRVNSTGNSHWAADGVAVTSLASGQMNPTLARDGGNGVFVIWRDQRSDSGDLYAQRVSESGVAQWTANGVSVATADGTQSSVTPISDGAGGALMIWQDSRFKSSSLFAQRISANGSMQWTANGVAVCLYTLSIGRAIVPDGVGGMIAAWDDDRSTVGGDFDVYAQHVDQWGYLGPQPVIAGIGDVRGDQGGVVRLSWTASPLDLFPSYSIYAYDVYRAVPADLATRLAGTGRAVIDAGEGLLPAAPGTLLRRTTAQGVQFWEFLESVLARHLSGYSYLAATTCDSMPGANPLTSFMVVARNSATTRWWCSDPDSGYSTDDLAPVAPAPFTGAYANGVATLLWGANGEGDLAGYRLYRGASASFTPGPANLVGAFAATAYADAAGQPYFYKLTAVDVHGNEGPAATLLPAGALAVDGGALPSVLTLSAPTPQPSRGATTLRLALPRATRVRLAVFDAQGRRVRVLLDEPRAAGEHALRWDGRDDAGRAVAGGLYLMRCEADDRVFLRRVAMLR